VSSEENTYSLRAFEGLGVTEDRRAADPEQALEESAARADELALAGGDDGAATWHRIMDAVTQLANTTPPGPVH
jgi:hypothetical protein